MTGLVRAATMLALACVAALFIYAAAELPPAGDPSSPPAAHVSPRYIEEGYAETGTPNLVTAVLADYRGYDTLGETVVVFTAGMAAILILTAPGLRRDREPAGGKAAVPKQARSEDGGDRP